MTNQPSEAAKRKAKAVLFAYICDPSEIALARHFDAEDRLAREALMPIDSLYSRLGGLEIFAQRFILPDPKPTLRSILLDESLNVEGKERAIRDAGWLREDES